MMGGHNKKSVRAEFVMSEREAELVKGRMAELGITNLSAYLRKMAVDGYIIHLDMSDIQEMIRLLRICLLFPVCLEKSSHCLFLSFWMNNQ